MSGWCGDASWAGWWWLVPLICMALCIMMRMFSGKRAASGRFGCWGGRSDADFGRMEKEIGELREEIARMKKGQR